MRCPCCDAVDVDVRQPHTCPRAGAQGKKHQPLLRAISRTNGSEFRSKGRAASHSLQTGTC